MNEGKPLAQQQVGNTDATNRPRGQIITLSAEIDEVAIYSTALSLAQVRQHYLAGRGVELVPVEQQA